MKIHTKNKHSKLSYALLVFTLLCLSMIYMSCSSKKDRSAFIKNSITQQNDENVDVNLKQDGDETLVKSESVRNKELDDESKKVMEENFRFIMDAFSSFKNSDTPIQAVYTSLKDFGLNPDARLNEAGVKIISSDESVDGLSYFRSRFNMDNEPQYFMFEVSPIKGGFDVAHELVKKHYPNLGKPCFETVDNVVAYQDEDFLVRIYEYTREDIEHGHPNKPRLEEHIGAVEVIIEYDVHPGTCGMKPEDAEKGHHDHGH